jgi:predicted small metal-binding protein
MKKMSCSVMGGPCDEMIMAETKEEMMQKGMDHVKKEGRTHVVCPAFLFVVPLFPIKHS